MAPQHAWFDARRCSPWRVVDGRRRCRWTRPSWSARARSKQLALLGFELGHRLMLARAVRRPRSEVGRSLRSVPRDLAPGVTVPFLDVHKGLVAHAVGDEARVDEMVQRYGPEPERVRDSLFGEYLLRVLADIVARSGATSMVGPVYDALLPYAGLLNAGGGLNAGLPVDDVLGRLAALAGDVRAAVRHATDAVALARAMPSPPMLVHCLDHLGDALAVLGDDAADAHWNEAAALAATVGVERAVGVPAPTARDDGGRAATMRRDATGWEVTSPIGAAQLPDSTGLGQLARLLSTPGVEVPPSSWPGDQAHRSPPTSARPSTPRPSAPTGSGCSSCRPRSMTPRPATTRTWRAGPRGDRRAPPRAGAGGRPRRPRPPERLRRRTGSGQRGAQPQAGDHCRSSTRLPISGRISRYAFAPVVTAPTFRSRPPP